jgi:hypothetical protein
MFYSKSERRKEMTKKNDGICHFRLFFEQLENVKILFHVKNNSDNQKQYKL